MIAWKYLDKKNATITAMRDYESMRTIINSTPDEIKDLYEKMTAPHTPSMTGMPPSKNPQAGTDKLVEQIDKLDILRERYSSAVEYMAWFESAWGTLNDTEQHILREFYMGKNQNSGATYRLMSKLGYSERQVERLKNKAITRLTILLYGK